MKALVTGGAGFIGSHLVDRLVLDGWDVIVLDDFSTGFRHNLRKSLERIRLIEASVLDQQTLMDSAAGCDVIFHFAAIASVARSIAEPHVTRRVNVEGTKNALVAAVAHGAKVVFSSSSAAYGQVEGAAREDLFPSPISPYGEHKVASEQMLQECAAERGIPTTALRYFNVYGERQDPKSDYAAVVPSFLTRAFAGEDVVIFGDGEQTRDFIHVSDVVRANILAATRAPGRGEVINVGSGIPVSVIGLARRVLSVMNADVAIRHEPGRANEIRHSHADTSRGKAALGFEAAVSLEEGLARAYEALLEPACTST